MDQVKYCPKCGGTLEADERFCGHCGFDTKLLEQSESILPKEASNNGFETAQREFNHGNKSNFENQKKSNKVLIIIASVLVFFFFVGGGAFLWLNRGDSPKNEKNLILKNPSYSLNEGTYTSEQNLTINKPSGEDVQIYYTLDGTEPTIQSSLYENPIILKSDATVKSVAIDKNGNLSEIKSASYLISIPKDNANQGQTETTGSSENAERALFESNIQGTWQMQEDSGYILYFSFIDGYFEVTDGGSDYYSNTYTFTIVPGNNGTLGTVYVVDKYVINIDCNPMGDNAIYIDGNFSTFYAN